MSQETINEAALILKELNSIAKANKIIPITEIRGYDYSRDRMKEISLYLGFAVIPNSKNAVKRFTNGIASFLGSSYAVAGNLKQPRRAYKSDVLEKAKSSLNKLDEVKQLFESCEASFKRYRKANALYSDF